MRHLARWAANLHVRTKFLLILLMAISLVSATALLSLHIPQEAYDEQLYQSSAQMITLFASQIESELTNFESLSYRILTDTALQKDLSTMKRLSPARSRGSRRIRTQATASPISVCGFPTRSAFKLRLHPAHLSVITLAHLSTP